MSLIASPALFNSAADLEAPCPICQEQLCGHGLGLTQRECGHMLHTSCYEDANEASGFIHDRCEVCRDFVKSSTRHGASLVTHFVSSKAITASTSRKRKNDAQDVPIPRSVGPSAGSAGEAGPEKSGKAKAKKRKLLAKEKEEKESGGFALMARGEAREQGVSIPAGSQRTCLPDAMWAAMKSLLPHTKLSLKEVRKSLPPSPDQADPNISMAKSCKRW